MAKATLNVLRAAFSAKNGPSSLLQSLDLKLYRHYRFKKHMCLNLGHIVEFERKQSFACGVKTEETASVMP